MDRTRMEADVDFLLAAQVDEYETAIDEMRSGKTIKTVLVW